MKSLSWSRQAVRRLLSGLLLLQLPLLSWAADKQWGRLFTNASFQGDAFPIDINTTALGLATSFGSFERLAFNNNVVLVLTPRHGGQPLYLRDTNEALPPNDIGSLAVVPFNATDAAVTLFSNKTNHGTMWQYFKPVKVPQLVTNETIGSIWILQQDLVVAVYTEPSYKGTRRFVISNCAQFNTSLFGGSIHSYQVMTREAMYAVVRRESKPTEVVLWTDRTFRNIPRGAGLDHSKDPFATYIQVQAGQGHVMGHLYAQAIMLDIPPGLAVATFWSMSFTQPSLVYTTSQVLQWMSSFRVLEASQAPQWNVVSSAVRLSTLKHDLDVKADEMLESTLIANFFELEHGFTRMSVPPGLQVVGYADMGLRGQRRIFPTGTYSYLDTFDQDVPFTLLTMQSFNVLRDTDDATPISPPASDRPPVVCSSWIPQGQRYMNTRFYADVDYPALAGLRCDTLTIPRGLAVVAFDRPWFLGRSRRLVPDPVTGYVRPNDGRPSFQFYSLQVVFMSGDSPSLPSSQVYATDQKFYSFPFPSDNPAMVVNAFGFTLHFDTVPVEAALVLYDKYNFEGNRTIVLRQPVGRSHTWIAKSYQFVSPNDVDRAPQPYVGCYPADFGINVEPIFMTAGEAISSLIYPWNHNIARVSVPNGLVVVVHSNSHFQGECAAWTSDTVLDGFWNASVQSLQVWNATVNRTWCLAPPVETTAMPPPKTSHRRPTTSPRASSLDDDNDQSIFNVSSTPIPTTAYLANEPFVANESTPTPKARTPSLTPMTGALEPPHNDATEAPQDRQKVSTSRHGLTMAVVIICSVVVVALLAVVIPWQRFRDETVYTTSVAQAYSTIQWHDLDLLRLDSPPLPLAHLLATGASGRIFLGTFLDQPVAIKTFLVPKPTPADVQALINEINLVGRLKNPFIVTLEGAAWSHPTNLQAVMEYMNLGDLRCYLASTTSDSFDWQVKLKCAHSVAEGLFYLHSQQLIHRDLKSRNVLLDSTKGAKLADFGSAKDAVYGDTLTAAVGTFRWMAPEMLLFQGYSNAVDIFSLGVILSELTTHQVPYSNQVDVNGRELSDEAIVRRVIHENLRPAFDPNCPVWFRTLGLSCMALNPDERPSATKVMYMLKLHLPDTVGSPDAS
ncbi:Aste57867_24536 [Aphanomyces stellatus]|uniref:Aste57867_24536 protein n=1 Tax=Aphanomyces stellatus TaxID=120398 RepID=A0A485LQW4_9STRA|nr:hypothetical protein As57867_024459 [Aphanomyces stellatus]VFU01175.1 Aste57867_24536 [Aphanomyces stellatus]